MNVRRGRFLALLGGAALSGCSAAATKLTESERFQSLLDAPERLDLALLGSGRPLAREYAASAIAADFRHNGFDPPSTAEYMRWLKDDWRGFKLIVRGMCERPAVYDLPSLRGKFERVSQITRHDCVEGWSVVGKWTGPRLRDVLASVVPKPEARYVVFRCMDDDGSGTLYYESLDMRQAAHPQTLLAYELNDRPVPPKNGAPVRLRVPTQLGYKSAKHVQTIELVPALGGDNGKGGYWEDRNYEWYAGI